MSAARRILAALLVVGVATDCQAGAPADVETQADRDAAQELTLAHPYVAAIDTLVAKRLARLIDGPPNDAPTPTTDPLLAAPQRSVDLGDPKVALHVRLVERARVQAIHAITGAEALLHKSCGREDFLLEQYLDAAARKHKLDYIRCSRKLLDDYQSAIHKLTVDDLDSYKDLKLPPHTLGVVLQGAKANVEHNDVSIELLFSTRRQLLLANENVIRFLDAREGHAHFSQGRMLFDDPADVPKFQDLLTELRAAYLLQG